MPNPSEKIANSDQRTDTTSTTHISSDYTQPALENNMVNEPVIQRDDEQVPEVPGDLAAEETPKAEEQQQQQQQQQKQPEDQQPPHEEQSQQPSQEDSALSTQQKQVQEDEQHQIDHQQIIPFSNQKISAFVHKLYLMLNDSSLDNVIRWSRLNENDDTTFALVPGSEFVNILTNYFKHGNVASFVRQLHMYGFHKVGNINYLHNSPSDSTKVIWEFRHSSGKFKKGDTTSLHLIKRRSNSLKHNSLHHSLINTSTNNTTNFYNTTTGVTTTTNNMDEWVAQQPQPHHLQQYQPENGFVQHDLGHSQVVPQIDSQQQLYYQQQQQQQQVQQQQQQQQQQQRSQQEYFNHDYTAHQQQYFVQQPAMTQQSQYFSSYPQYQIVYQQPMPSEIERSNSGASISDETDVSFNSSSRRSRVPSVFIDPLAPVPANAAVQPQQPQQVMVTHRIVNAGTAPGQYIPAGYEIHPHMSQQQAPPQNGGGIQYVYPPQNQPPPRGGSYPTLVLQQQPHLYAPRPPRSLPNEFIPSGPVVPISHPSTPGEGNGYGIPQASTPNSQGQNFQTPNLYKHSNQSPTQQQQLQQQPRSTSLPSHQSFHHQAHHGSHALHVAHHNSQPHIRSSLVNMPNSISSASNHTKSISSSKSDSIFSNTASVSYHPGSIAGFANSSISSSSTSNNSISFPPSSPTMPPSHLQPHGHLNSIGSNSKISSIISNSLSRTSLSGILNDDNERPGSNNASAAASLRNDSLASTLSTSYPTSPKLRMMSSLSSSNSISMSRPMSPQQLINNGDSTDHKSSSLSNIPVELKNPVPINSATSKLTSFSAYTRSSIFGHNSSSGSGMPKGAIANRLSLVSPTSIPLSGPTSNPLSELHIPDRGSVVSPTSIPLSSIKDDNRLEKSSSLSTVESSGTREKELSIKEEDEYEHEHEGNGDGAEEQAAKKRKMSDKLPEENITEETSLDGNLGSDSTKKVDAIEIPSNGATVPVANEKVAADDDEKH